VVSTSWCNANRNAREIGTLSDRADARFDWPMRIEPGIGQPVDLQSG